MVRINRAWVNFHNIDPPPAFERSVQGSNAFTSTIFATRQFDAILNQPIPNTVAGLFFAGFWVSLALSLLNFILYISVTAQQRIVSFGVLRSLGWNINHIWRLMFMEQTVLFVPTVIIGTLLGIGLAFLLLPFLALPGNFALQLPLGQILMMAVILSASFLVLLSGVSMWLRQVSVATMLRLGED
jgi:ABC-type antimicrobial peptide transport system permease subunit